MPQFIANNLIIRYPHLVEPWSSGPQYTADYNAQFIVPQDWAQWTEFSEIVEKAIQEKHGANRPTNMKLPWQDKYLQPNIKPDAPHAGCYFFNAAGKQTKPGVVDAARQHLDDLQVKTLIFSGCLVNALLGIYAYADGVGVALNGVQLVDNQNIERIPDAGRNVSEVFKAIPGAPPAIMPAFQGPNTEENPFG